MNQDTVKKIIATLQRNAEESHNLANAEYDNYAYSVCDIADLHAAVARAFKDCISIVVKNTKEIK